MKKNIVNILKILPLLIIIVLSFAFPTIFADIKEKNIISTPKSLPQTEDFHQNKDSNTLVTEQIQDINVLLNLYVNGSIEKTQEVSITEKSPIVLMQLMHKQIDKLIEMNILPDTDFAVNESQAYLCSTDDIQTLLWKYTLTDSKGNELEVTYHSGVDLIIAFDFEGDLGAFSKEINLEDTYHSDSDFIITFDFEGSFETFEIGRTLSYLEYLLFDTSNRINMFKIDDNTLNLECNTEIVFETIKTDEKYSVYPKTKT